MAGGLVSFISSHAAAESYPPVKLHFPAVGNVPTSVPFSVPKGCLNDPNPGPGHTGIFTMTQATITMGPIQEETKGTLTNLAAGESDAVIDLILHSVLRMNLVGIPTTIVPFLVGPVPHDEGQTVLPCPSLNALGVPQPNCGLVPAMNGNFLAGSFGYHFCGSNPCVGFPLFINFPAFTTVGPAAVTVINNLADLATYFKATPGNLTFDGNFTTAASQVVQQSGSFEGSILTDANATIIVNYTCVEQGVPSFVCNFKTFDKTTTSTADTLVHVTGRFTNTGTGAIPDLIITDVVTKPAGATVTLLNSSIGAPVQGPAGTWTFPSQNLPEGGVLNYSFDVQITGLGNNEVVSDQITGRSASLVLSSDGPACSASITRREQGKVPAMGTMGLALLLAVVAASGVFLLRRRQRA